MRSPRLLIGLTAACALGCSNQAGPTEPTPDATPDTTTDAPAARILLGQAQQVAGCQRVEVTATREGTVAEEALTWEVEGYPVLGLERVGADGLAFVAPSNTRGETLTVKARAGEVVGEVTVTVTPSPGLTGAEEIGMAPDCAPFIHGVASGDPKPNEMLIWTQLPAPEGAPTAAVRWEVARDAFFEDVVASDEEAVPAERGRALTVRVTGLEPSTTYYYRFRDADGAYSATGRTKTAGAGDVAEATFAVASCSSIYSGYFNAYRRIAERDLDAVIHLGDYIYDFADADEPVRIPAGGDIKPSDYAGWASVHAYHLHDPDLRAARAAHPWVVMWDNHDVAWKIPEEDWEGSVRAFRQHVPMGLPVPEKPEIGYRGLQWGSLVDLVVLDVLMHRESGAKVPGTEEASILGDTQWDWLDGRLTGTPTTWRILGSQKVMGTIRVNPALVGGREVFDPKTWDGFPASRTRLLTRLAELGLRDNLTLSGDSHVSVALDLTDDPDAYDPATGAGSVGVELLPTSISRGNFDEQLGGVVPVIRNIQADTLTRNPHHAYIDLVKHGYGLVTFTPERLIARIYYSDILEPSDTEEMGMEMTAEKGAGQWTR